MRSVGYAVAVALVLAGGCGIDSRGISLDTRFAGQPEQLRVDPVLHAERAEIEYPLREVSNQRHQPVQDAVANRRIVVQQASKYGRLHRGKQRVFECVDVHRA